MVRFLLFTTSLSPAIAIASVRLYPSLSNYLSFSGYLCLLVFILSELAFVVICFLLTYCVLRSRTKVSPKPFIPLNVKDDTDRIPTYLITFVFPFLFLSDTPSSSTVVAYGIFAVLMMALLFSTDIPLVNFALLFIGYHTFTIETPSETLILISRRHPEINVQLEAHPISGTLYLRAEETKE